MNVLSSPLLGNFLPSTLAELGDLLRTDLPGHFVSSLTFGGPGFDLYSVCAVKIFQADASRELFAPTVASTVSRPSCSSAATRLWPSITR